MRTAARSFDTILVTGGAGFIGSNFIRYILGNAEFSGRVVNVDALTYAGNLENLSDIARDHGEHRYHFVHADICDRAAVEKVFASFRPDSVVHFAAESHVDRSVRGPEAFVRTNVLGTFTLLDVARMTWEGRQGVLFHHVSTDEVFGSLGQTGSFAEDTRYDPRSPYSASKAGSDHLVMSYFHTYGFPVTLSNCSNNYGPRQFPEKLIPLMILNMLAREALPVYGDGQNVRDWIHVDDHSSAVWRVITEGKVGEKYNVGGRSEWPNLQLVKSLCAAVSRATGTDVAELEKLITFVKDRPGHDRRYAIDCSKIERELGWRPCVSLTDGIEDTVRWYLENQDWVAHGRSGAYREWIDQNYRNR